MNSKKLLAAAAALCLAVPAGISVQSAAEDLSVKGDVNADLVFNLADMVTFTNWLNGNGSLSAAANGDVNEDGKCDVFDLSAMRKLLIKCINDAPALAYKTKARNLCAGINASQGKGKDADETFIDSQTKFTVDIFKEVYAEKENPENTLVSPYSIMQALAMTANGAAGQTRDEMEEVLGNGIDIEILNSYLLTQRTRTVNAKKNEYNNWSVDTANAVWAKDSEKFIPCPQFIQNCVDYYDSEYYIAPFDDTTLADVNNWVNDKTHEMIPEILKKIDPLDVMYLVNAVAFEAQWSEPYTEYAISDGKFTAADGTVQEASMLCSIERYIGDENTQGIIKSYSGGRYAFAALLPDEGTTVDKYIEELTPDKLNALLSSRKNAEANVKLPKFKYDYEIKLNRALCSMGMPTAFSRNADFTNMYSGEAGKDIYISYVTHKTFIDLDENGTKAAAATIVAMTEKGEPMKPDKDIVFDRPFVYCIFDTQTNLPLFIGALNSLS